jgi:SAM-dependent methyltransferase
MKHLRPTSPVVERLTLLAEPTRLRMLRLLQSDELSVGEIAKVIQSPQSTVSRHLKLLSDGGWLERRTEGPAALYRLVLDNLAPETRRLWATVRDQLGQTPEFAEDRRRLAAVLDERNEHGVIGRLAGEWDGIRSQLFGREFTPMGMMGLLRPEWEVADLGCGTGNAAELVAGWVDRVIAIDRAESMLERARARLRAHRNIEFRAGDLSDLPIESASLDAVVCVLVLHHLADPALALHEMARVLRTGRGGGVALVIDMLEHDRAEYRQTMGHLHQGFSEADACGMLEAAGFASVAVAPLRSESDAKGPGLFAARGWLDDRIGAHETN